MRRLVTLLLAAALAAAGCARHETRVAQGDRDQVLLVGNKDEPTDMDPQINSASSTGTLLSALFQGIVQMANDNKTVLPGTADRWEFSGDGLTVTFHMRDGATWSNGAPFTSRDIYDSYLRLLDPQVASETAGQAYFIRGARDYVEGRLRDPAGLGISAPDPHTFVMRLEHPTPYLFSLLSNYSFYPVYMPSLDAAGGRHQRGGPWTRPGVLVSNGPFTLAEWKPNAYVRVVRNPNFWDAAHVRLKEVRFYPTDDENGEERDFRAGQLHVTARLPKAKVPTYRAEHPEELHLNTLPRVNYVTFNVARAPFTDPRVRRAFSLAIDRERLVAATLGELGTPARALSRPGLGGYDSKAWFAFDPAEAKAQLAAAGYPGGAGMPAVEFTLNGNAGVTLEVAEVLRQMWAENLGVRVTVVPVEFKSYLSLSREHQFQVLLDSWFPLPDPRDILELGVTGDPDNDSGASFPDYDAAFAASDRAADPAARGRAFDAMESVNAREVFYAPLYYLNNGFLVRPSVRGWHDNSGEWIDWRTLYLEP